MFKLLRFDVNFLEYSIYAFVLLERSLIGEVWVSLVISNTFSAVIKISHVLTESVIYK